jgi:cytidine deaminase
MSKDKELFDAARDVMRRAHAPYSCFYVGAALRAQDGRVYAGANVENAAYPESVCAETAAIAAFVAGGGHRITEICVIADSSPPITPCGGCRQRLAEFGDPDMIIYAATPDGIKRRFTLGELLPEAFDLADEF